MQKILIPVSAELPKDKILDHIRLVSGSNTTHIVLFRSISMPDSVGYMQGDENDDQHEINLARQEHLGDLSELEEQLKISGYTSESFVMIGQLEEDLTNLIQTTQPDLILMLTEGAQNLFEDIFGTNTSSIIEKIKVPMLVIRFNRIQHSLKKAVVGLPTEEDNLYSVKKYFDFSDYLNLKSDFIKIDENFELIEDSYLAKLKELYPDRAIHINQRESENVADGIEKYAVDSNADLIVLFSTNKYFLEKIFDPSITQSLIKHCKVPLLIFHC